MIYKTGIGSVGPQGPKGDTGPQGPAGTGGGGITTFQDFYRLQSKSGKKIVWIGDSTTNSAFAGYLHTRLANYIAVGQLLEGVTSVNKGVNGSTVRQFVTNTATGSVGIDGAIADQGDLYIISYGINDIRVSGSTPTTIRADIKTVIDRIITETTGFILLRTPNSFMANGDGYITPASSANEYTQQLYEIYESLRGYSPRVDIIDMQGLVFGRKALATNPLMNDSLHPNQQGMEAIADEIVERISGKGKNDFESFADYDLIMKGYVTNITQFVSTKSVQFFTNSPATIQIDDVVYVGSSYSFVIDQTPTYNSTTKKWTVMHTSHTGSFNQFGVVRIVRRK